MSQSMKREAMLDDVCGHFNTGWNASSFVEHGSIPQIYWPRDTRNPGPPDNSKGYVGFSIIHTGGRQASLGGVGNRIFTRNCVLVAQLFTPLQGDVEKISRELSKNAITILEGKSTPRGIAFLDVVPIEAGVSGGWYQINVQAKFEYDEVL